MATRAYLNIIEDTLAQLVASDDNEAIEWFKEHIEEVRADVVKQEEGTAAVLKELQWQYISAHSSDME